MDEQEIKDNAEKIARETGREVLRARVEGDQLVVVFTNGQKEKYPIEPAATGIDLEKPFAYIEQAIAEENASGKPKSRSGKSKRAASK